MEEQKRRQEEQRRQEEEARRQKEAEWRRKEMGGEKTPTWEKWPAYELVHLLFVVVVQCHMP